MMGYFRKNLWFRLMSIFAALFIWFFVFSERNPITDRVVSVPVEIVELSRDLVVSEGLSSVSLRFQGKTNIIERISSRDFGAYVSLKDMGVGIETVQVNVNVPPGIRLISVQPALLEVKIDQVASIQRPVQVVTEGTPAKGYLVVEPRLNPAEVIIKGPQGVLDNVKKVYVSVNVNNIYSNYFKSLPVLVEDASQRLILGQIEVLPSVIDVLIPIIGDNPSRLVPIVVNYNGEVAPGKKIGKTLINPEVVKIYGAQDIINKIGYLSLEIKVDGLRESKTFELELNLPRGVMTPDEEIIEVMVEIIDEN